MTYPPPPPPYEPPPPSGPPSPYGQQPPNPAQTSGQPWAQPEPYTPPNPYAPPNPYGQPQPQYGPPQQPGYQPTTAYPAYTPGPGYPGDPSYPQGAPGPAPKRSAGLIIGIVVVLALLLCGGVGVAGVLAYNSSKDDPGVAESSSPDPAKNASPTPSRTQDNSGPAGSASGKKVVFEVTGDGPVSLVYLRESGQPPVTVRDVELPWREEFTPERLLLISLTAIRGATTNGKLTCRVTVDGEEVVSKTSEGNFITAICTKSLLN